MKKLLIVFYSLLLGFYLIKASVIKADYAATYQSYINLTDLYRNLYQNYISSKNKYLTYHTLTSQNEALENGRVFLKARDQLIAQYLKLLRDKTSEAGGFSDSERNLIFNKLNVENAWLVDHRTRYDTAGTINDLQRISDQTQDRYNSIIRYVALQTAGSILANKEQVLTTTINDILTKMDITLKKASKLGDDTSLAQRWLLEAQNKVILASERQSEAVDAFTNLHGQNLVPEYNRGVFSLTESNQYLKEASSYVSEILRILKGG